MGNRTYTINMDGVTVSATQDLFEINTDSNMVVQILSAHLGQDGTADYGDAQAEGLTVDWTTVTASGTPGTIVTPYYHGAGTAAFSGTAAINNLANAGTDTVRQSHTFHVQAGWFYQPSPEEYLSIPPSSTMVLALKTAPNDAVNMNGHVTFRVID